MLFVLKILCTDALSMCCVCVELQAESRSHWAPHQAAERNGDGRRRSPGHRCVGPRCFWPLVPAVDGKCEFNHQYHHQLSSTHQLSLIITNHGCPKALLSLTLDRTLIDWLGTALQAGSSGVVWGILWRTGTAWKGSESSAGKMLQRVLTRLVFTIEAHYKDCLYEYWWCLVITDDIWWSLFYSWLPSSVLIINDDHRWYLEKWHIWIWDLMI